MSGGDIFLFLFLIFPPSPNKLFTLFQCFLEACLYSLLWRRAVGTGPWTWDFKQPEWTIWGPSLIVSRTNPYCRHWKDFQISSQTSQELGSGALNQAAVMGTGVIASPQCPHRHLPCLCQKLLAKTCSQNRGISWVGMDPLAVGVNTCINCCSKANLSSSSALS